MKSKKVLVRYSSNNSGGGWWLKDKDWKALEKAGWKVKWYSKAKKDPIFGVKEGRWLGALATEASKKFNSIAEAIREWEKVTKQDASDEGCNCCGCPHGFSTEDPYEYVSGEEIANLLNEVESKSYRELVEEVAKLRKSNRTIDS